MEEILASIRSIIADDREPVAARPAPKPDAAPSGPQIVYSKDESRRRATAEPPNRAPPAEPPTPKVVWSQPQPQASRVRQARRSPSRRLRRGGGVEARAGAGRGRRAAAFRPGRPGRFRRVRRPLDQLGAAKLRTGRERGARNPAAAAEDLARREPPQHGRAAGARRDPARRARRPLIDRRLPADCFIKL